MTKQDLNEFVRGYVGWMTEDGRGLDETLYREALFYFNRKYKTEFEFSDIEVKENHETN